jgi:hypothetical protein
VGLAAALTAMAIRVLQRLGGPVKVATLNVSA